MKRIKLHIELSIPDNYEKTDFESDDENQGFVEKWLSLGIRAEDPDDLLSKTEILVVSLRGRN